VSPPTGRAALCAVALVLAGAAPALAADVPYLTGRVVDAAEVLRPETRQKLAAELKAHEERTTNQVVVLTVPSLEGESVEDFARQVFEAWKLGRRDKDNGVLILVAPSDRKMRIEVGYGLEGSLPDAVAGRIIRNQMTPRFKANDFDGGISAGAGAVVAVLEGRGEEVAGAAGSGDGPPAAASQGARKRTSFDDSVTEFEKDLPPWPMRILLGAFIFGIIGLFTFMGIVTPGSGWFLYFFLIPFWAMFPIVVVGIRGALTCLVTYVVGFPLAKLIVRRKPWYAKATHDLKSKGKATIGGMVISGGSSGGSWSSGGSSGGGFSGGGGSSGGGGASGSW
jgi:uncharacterized protein